MSTLTYVQMPTLKISNLCFSSILRFLTRHTRHTDTTQTPNTNPGVGAGVGVGVFGDGVCVGFSWFEN